MLPVRCCPINPHRAFIPPSKAHKSDVGLDLYVSEDVHIKSKEMRNVGTNTRISLPHGYWAYVVPRSSTFSKRGLIVHSGVIDPGYSGELSSVVYNNNNEDVMIKAGERISQIVVIPWYDLGVEVVDTVRATRPEERGDNGFGSTGF